MMKFVSSVSFCKISLLSLVVTSMALTTRAQSPNYTKTNGEVAVIDSGYPAKASVYLLKKKKVRARESRTYAWHRSYEIHRTVGGVDGQVLNGWYTQYHKDHDLRKRGKYRFGLKVGKWMQWDENGHVRQIVNYRQGKAHGAFRYYNEKNELQKSGKHCEGKVHGRLREYDGDSAKVFYYKKGNLREYQAPGAVRVWRSSGDAIKSWTSPKSDKEKRTKVDKEKSQKKDREKVDKVDRENKKRKEDDGKKKKSPPENLKDQKTQEKDKSTDKQKPKEKKTPSGKKKE
ncbi:MAG: hypothetical protein KDD36_01495 [Flavobacteriales bacterium]|nr:hypothetical protein [Flavobacteriales bacterium]